MAEIGSDHQRLARHGQIIGHNNDYLPTPGPHSTKTDSDGDMSLPTGGAVVGGGDEVTITLEIEALKQA